MSDIFDKRFNVIEDYYEILGVDKDAKIDEISKKYRQLARKHHPDHGGNVEMFELLSRAYECLSNNEKRKQYDLEYLNRIDENYKNEHTMDYFKHGYEQFLAENTKPLNKDEIDSLYNDIFTQNQVKDEPLTLDNFKDKYNNFETERKMYDIEDDDNYFAEQMKMNNDKINISDVYEFMNMNKNNNQVADKPMMTYDLMPNSNVGYSLFNETSSNIAEFNYSPYEDNKPKTKEITKDFNMEEFNKWSKNKKTETKLTNDDFSRLLKERELETQNIINSVELNFKHYEKTDEIKKFIKIENDIHFEDLNLVD